MATSLSEPTIECTLCEHSIVMNKETHPAGMRKTFPGAGGQ